MIQNKDIINLYNRDGATLNLIKNKKITSDISEWIFNVDKAHEWVLEHCRVIGNPDINIEAVDPAGGPFLSVGDIINKYQIVKIVDCTTFWLSERNNN